MDATARLINAIAAFVGAVAWPSAFLIALLLFRSQLRDLLGRVRKGKVGFVELELEQLTSTVALKEEQPSGAITIEQVRSAARIKGESDEIGQTELLRQFDKLGIEYDTIRRTMSSGPTRTAAMTRVLIQMRALGPSVVSHIDAYKGSGSPGARLGAVAIMQMEPQSADLPWLVARFQKDAPFIFYHAALALQNVANDADGVTRGIVRQAALEALAIVRSFVGAPDQETIEVLEPLAA